MTLLKRQQFRISLLVGIALFVVTCPFYHNMYIAKLHTVLCICLNAFSAVLFSVFFYCKRTNCINKNRRIIFIGLTVIQMVGHGVFAVMNWGSFFFLGLSLAVIIMSLVFISKRSKSKYDSDLYDC